MADRYQITSIVRRSRMVFAGALLVAAASVARAETITLSEFFFLPIATGGPNPLSAHVFSLTQFDPALGMLDSVEIDLVRGPLAFSWSVDNEGPSPVSLIDTINPAARMRLSSLGGELASFIQSGPPFASPFLSGDTDLAPNFTGSDAETFVGSFPLFLETITLTDPLMLSPFVGTGAILLEESVLFLPTGVAPFVVDDVTLAQSGAGVIARYQFTPVVRPVPEPSTLALVLCGACGVLARVRHRVSRNHR